jgi:hypothetical protein
MYPFKPHSVYCVYFLQDNLPDAHILVLGTDGLCDELREAVRSTPPFLKSSLMPTIDSFHWHCHRWHDSLTHAQYSSPKLQSIAVHNFSGDHPKL